MVLQLSIKDEKSELFLSLMEELKVSMIDKLQIISSDTQDYSSVEDSIYDEDELLQRMDEIENNRVKPLSREEVFDGIC